MHIHCENDGERKHIHAHTTQKANIPSLKREWIVCGRMDERNCVSVERSGGELSARHLLLESPVAKDGARLEVGRAPAARKGIRGAERVRLWENPHQICDEKVARFVKGDAVGVLCVEHPPRRVEHKRLERAPKPNRVHARRERHKRRSAQDLGPGRVRHRCPSRGQSKRAPVNLVPHALEGVVPWSEQLRSVNLVQAKVRQCVRPFRHEPRSAQPEQQRHPTLPKLTRGGSRGSHRLLLGPSARRR
mmetsp:Transcript_18925/g.61735  ORF Transcript_18925/g.61735 Transcript_18925/m.61735 type:complete len:247 (-) Transcript_18925:201-941(-)